MTAYLGLDLHANSCTLGVMREGGTYQGDQQFPTTESELVPRIASVDASEKRLVLEASTLSRWAARLLDPYVEEVFVCDPRENHLLSRNPGKSDRSDVYNLCRLLRLGELKALSYRAWMAALRHGDNQVARFFEQSLERTGDRSHARLNTQRKILATLLSLWKNDSSYQPERFLGSA